MKKHQSWALIEAPIPNAPEAKYISQIPSPNNLLQISSALKSKGVQDITFYNFLKEREPKAVTADKIVYNLGEATCMDYLYNYALKYLDNLRMANMESIIYLTGYHAWLHHKWLFPNTRIFGPEIRGTSPHFFENDILSKEFGTGLNIPNHTNDWHNDWSINDWIWMDNNVRSKTKGIRTTIRASRGCGLHCRMCPVPLTYGNFVKRFPVEWVLEEIGELYTKYKVRQIGFLDDNLFINKTWGRKLLHQIIERKYKGLWFTFEEGLTVPTALDEELISLLKEAHFTHIKLGVESFNKKTLEFIQKPYRDPNMAIKAIKLLQKYKLNPTCFLCIGFPTDTRKQIEGDIKKLVDLGVKLRVQILWEYPGISFANKSPMSHKELKELQQRAMIETGSCSWKKKEVSHV